MKKIFPVINAGAGMYEFSVGNLEFGVGMTYRHYYRQNIEVYYSDFIAEFGAAFGGSFPQRFTPVISRNISLAKLKSDQLEKQELDQ